MKKYKERNIEFRELIQAGEWKVKSYTISQKNKFHSDAIYQNAIESLPNWLKMQNSFNASNYKVAFLICHEANEGVFTLINWWVGENMLNSHVFLSDYESPEDFKKISGDGLTFCVWEHEIINHERISWKKHILKNPKNPDYSGYLNDTFNGAF